MISLAQHLQPWWSLPVAVLDFETTGSDPATCAAVELAVVRFENGQPVERYSALIDPGCPIPAEAHAIHGITDEMVKGAGTARAAWSGAVRLLLGAIPCAYSAPFDRTILHRILPDALDGVGGFEYLELQSAWPWLDPLVVVRHVDRFEKGKGRHKLTTTCERWGVKLEGAHRATNDAEAQEAPTLNAIRAFLAARGGAASRAEIVRALGKRTQAVAVALSRLKRDGVVVNERRGEWRLAS